MSHRRDRARAAMTLAWAIGLAVLQVILPNFTILWWTLAAITGLLLLRAAWLWIMPDRAPSLERVAYSGQSTEVSPPMSKGKAILYGLLFWGVIFGVGTGYTYYDSWQGFDEKRKSALNEQRALVNKYRVFVYSDVMRRIGTQFFEEMDSRPWRKGKKVNEVYPFLLPNKAVAVCIDWEKSDQFAVRISSWGVSDGHSSPIWAHMRAEVRCHYSKAKIEPRTCEVIDEDGKNILAVPEVFVRMHLLR